MELGELVIWRGRLYRLRGFDPMSVVEPCVYVEDEVTGERVWVGASEVEPAAVGDPGRAG